MSSLLSRMLALFAVAALVLTGCSAEQESPAQVSRTLPNGVRVLAKENRASGVVAVQAWIADGALYEESEDAGSAYLLSQMMFTRTRDRELGEISQMVEELGGSSSVNPRHDFIQYAAVAPSEHFDVLVELLADGLKNAVFDSSYFEETRVRVLEDIESVGRSPMERTHLLCISDMLGEHPYARPNQGSAEVVRALTLRQLRERYRERYTGANLLISVAGDIDPASAADELEARLSGVDAGFEAEPSAPAVEWPKDARRIVRRGDVRTAYQVMCFPAPSITDSESITMDVLLMILAGGRSSRLDRILTEEQRLATAVDAGWYTLRQPSPLYVWMELSPRHAEKAEESVLEILREMSETEITERELQKAKTYWKTQIFFLNETAEGQAFYDAYWTFLGWPELPREYLESIEQVTAEDIRRAAEVYFGPGGYTTALLLPEWAQD